ncbi:phage tail domain-containing protein [Staphylococcus saprophyticus]|uniref:phage tail domain-containing protein n=1 Tax=Staphylococcus saprophyticus TaxID=29385 RepID=UPI0036E9ED30
MNEIQFPVGVKPLDFFVSSIEKERKEQQIDGIPGVVDYGFNYKQRDASMTFWLRHFHSEHDYFLLESDLNAFLDSHEYFYVARNALPSRVIKVTVDGSFKPERILGSMYAQLEVDARITGLPFWRTKYTTQEIESSGYSAIVEKYGMADGINVDYLPYKFTTNEFTVWNGGNVVIDPRNMILNIKLNYVKTEGNLRIENLTTGEVFIYKDRIENYHLILEGVKTKVGLYNQLRNTNRKFLSLVPGENKIKISNGTFDSINIDCPFYFK